MYSLFRINEANENEMETSEDLLESLFTTFANGLRSSRAETPRGYLKGKGLDWIGLNLGFNSGQSFHGALPQYIQSYLDIGFIWRSPQPQNVHRPAYSQFGIYSIIFPLRNEAKRIVNFYGIRIDLKEEQRAFWNDRGLYPGFPPIRTRKMYVTRDVLDAATLVQSAVPDNRESVVALFDGELRDQHISALKALAHLESVVCIGCPDAAVEAIREALPHVLLSRVDVPDDTSLNDLWKQHRNTEALLSLLESVSSPPGESARTSTLTVLSPQKISYRGVTGEFQVVGFLPADLGKMSVTIVFVHHKDGRRYRRKVDLFDGAQIAIWTMELIEHGVHANLMEADLLRLADELEAHRDAELDRQMPVQKAKHSMLSPTERHQAMEMLMAPDLLLRIDRLIETSGVTGEEKIRLLLYIAATTCKNANMPLQTVVQGSSGSGKSHVVNSISACLPPELVLNMTRATAKSFYNFTGGELQNVCLVIQDMDGIDKQALLALRELQSYGAVQSATTYKDKYGNLQSVIRTVEGNFSSLGATTRGELYYDNESRSILVGVDESEAQTRRIIDYQNRLIAGLVDTDQQTAARHLLQNMLRLLEPAVVVNPYATAVLLPPEARMLRRLNAHFQLFVRQVAWFHQFQRPRDDRGRIHVTPADLRFAADILFPAVWLKVDELHHSLRHFFEQLKSYILSQPQGMHHAFTAREVRHALRISKSHLFRHLQELQKLEYIQIAGGSANRGYTYRLAYTDDLEKVKTRLKAELDEQINRIEA